MEQTSVKLQYSMFQENASKYVVYKIRAILIRPQSVNQMCHVRQNSSENNT